MEQQFQFGNAAARSRRLRLNLEGVSGAGKTWTALGIAEELGERRYVIDTEHGSALLYDEDFPWVNDHYLELGTYHPQAYINAIVAAERNGADVIVIDSLTHAWAGVDGALALHAKAAKESGNSYTAWRDITPLHNALVEKLLASPAHIITTLRTKTEYVMETNDRGKQFPRKVGMAPIFREGIEYEFTVNLTLDRDHNAVPSKTRIKALDGVTFLRPGRDLGLLLRQWADKRGKISVPAQVPVEESSSPVASERPTESAPIDEAFVAACERERERIGDEAYAAILQAFGPVELIAAIGQKRSLFGLLKAHPAKPVAKGDALATQLEKES